MATSISNLAFKATLDVAKLAEGGRLGRDAFKALKDAAGETKNDLQKLGDFEALLAKEVAAGTITQEHYTKAVTAYWSALPSGIKAEKDRKDAIEATAKAAKEAAAEQERYDKILAAESEKLKPKELRASEDALSFGADYEQMLATEKEQAILNARKDDAAAAEKKHAATVAEGDAIMQRHKPALQGYREQVGHLNDLLKAGAIDQRAHSREVAAARGSLLVNAAGLSGIPIVGDAARTAATAMTMHPALAAVAGSAYVAKKAIGGFIDESERIDEVSKAARKLGVSTEAYLTFAETARFADVSMEQVGDGIFKMTRAIGEANEGGKTQQDAIARLGLDYKQLAAMRPEDAFLKISDALRQIKDPFAAATIQQDLFGRSAVQMADVLRMGSEEFAAIQGKLSMQGRLFTSEDGEKMEQANDAIAALGDSYKGLKQSAAIAASDGVLAFVAALDEAISGTRSLDDAMSELEKRRLGSGKVRTENDTSKNLGEAGGMLLDFIMTPINVLGRGDQRNIEERMTDRVRRQASDEQEKIKAAAAELDASANTEYEAKKGEFYAALKRLNEARAGGNAAGIAKEAEAVQRLNAELDRMDNTPPPKPQEDDGKYKESAEKYIEGLKAKQAAAAGDVEQSAKLQAEKAGLKGDDVAEAVAIEEKTKQIQAEVKAKQEVENKTKQLAASVENFTAGLRAQAETFGMSSRQAQLYALQAKGATEEQLADAKRIVDSLDAMEAKKKKQQELETFAKQINDQSATAQDKYREQTGRLTEAFQKGLIDAGRYYDGLDKAKKDLLSGMSINVESLKTPAQKYADELAKLDKAHKAGALSLADMTKMKQRAAEEFSKPLSVNMKTSGVDAAMQGSVEALDRIEAFRQMMAAQKQQQVDVDAAKKDIETKERDKAGAIAGLTEAREQKAKAAEEAPRIKQIEQTASEVSQYAADIGLDMPSIMPLGGDEYEDAPTRTLPTYVAKPIVPDDAKPKDDENQVLSRLAAVLERLDRGKLVVTETPA